MEIRKRLLYQFIGIVAAILVFVSLSVYFLFAEGRKQEYYERLGSKARLVAQMLIDIDEIDAELLKKIEKNNPVSLQNEKIIIFDYKDSIVYSTDEESLLKITPEMISEVRLKDELRVKQNPYEILGQFYAGKYDRYVVFAAAQDIYGLRKLIRLRVILFIVFIISLFVVYFSGKIFVSRALIPVSDIMAQVGAIGESNLNARISEGNGRDELSQLARTFNKMLERIESAFNTQKYFIANASHELRTPLTVITGQLEVVLMKARDNEEYRKTITSVLANIKNLNSISNRLLQLAQASTEISATDFRVVRVDEILWQARQDVLKLNSDYQINISLSDSIDDENKLQVMGNNQLLRTAISNIMDNGCKYSDDHTSEVFVNNDNNSIIMTFTDKGIGISEEDLKMIFQPFYRAKNANGTKGHGIGLPLVQKIISLHEGEIHITSEVSKGSTFMISLPLEEIKS